MRSLSSAFLEDHRALRTAVQRRTRRGELVLAGFIDDDLAVALLVVREELRSDVVTAAVPGAAVGVDSQLHPRSRITAPSTSGWQLVFSRRVIDTPSGAQHTSQAPSTIMDRTTQILRAPG
jgi:hypothetical protein